MFSGLAFIGVTLLVLSVALLYVHFKLRKVGTDIITYLKNDLGIVKGIVLFILFGLGLVFVSNAFSQEVSPLDKEFDYFVFGKVYIGLDQTFDRSPQCDPGPASDSLTSNGGFIVNLMKSRDTKMEFNLKYTHHSCAFNGDRESYDAAGLVVEYRIW